jgi:tRNA modification GTPase
MSLTDTIFARASGAGAAAIAVLRMSGPGTADILTALAGRLPPPRRASLRPLRGSGTGELLDQALILWFPGPESYTGEDSAELHVHGGPAVVAGVMAELAARGARPAEAGEFTRRAFVHGRVDLTQAEAIADLIAAETAAQRRLALRQADGELTRLYGGWTLAATQLLAQQEAAIEFQMDDLPTDLESVARREAAALLAELQAHLDDDGRGERLRDGLSIVIVGAPNAGKSTLLNALAGREAAIVSDVPGTTRDIVEIRLILEGVPAVLADTAGLRAATDAIELEGVRRARRRAEEADLLILAFAADAPLDAETLALRASVPKVLVVVTKADLGPGPGFPPGIMPIRTSARSGAGLPDLRSMLTRLAVDMAGVSEAPVLTRARHRAALTEAAAELRAGMDAPLPELAAEGYRAALRALGRLTGRVEVEQVLDAVFGKFCIGK